MEHPLARFRDQASGIRDRASRQFYLLLFGALLAVCTLYVAMIAWRTPGSALLWPIASALVASIGLTWWAGRNHKYMPALVVLAAFMLAGICGVIVVQRGSNAAGVIYGLTTVAVVLIAGLLRIGWLLGCCLAAWTAAVAGPRRSG